MARDAVVVLHNLECISQQDNIPDKLAGQAPYIWPVLMWIDDTTLSDPSLLVDGTIPGLADSRVVLQAGMRPGDTASIPYPQGTLGHRFEDNLVTGQLLLAVLVWVQHDTPGEAVWAGCKAFSSAMRAAAAANLGPLANPATRQQTIQIIQGSVAGSVDTAIRDALSWTQKVEVAIGAMHLDEVIGSDFNFFPDLTAADFTLSMSDTSGNSYAVPGGLRVRVPAVDLCQAQADQVTAKQASVDGINNQIITLQVQLQHASPAEKPYIVADIVQASKDLAVAQHDLADARTALKACRDHWAQVVGRIPRPPDIPIITTS